ncbi:hypothetical protein EDB92DRAFT_1940971 [Lactarius akahatsu]|uniref:Uncharacterized protein n=1 Tax=Lactarius akahatsu TaxID=416441 RepID=A0AAD4QH91_9AGAM|nr:hypothetical protein EDB92DRAFT_1940971 [Lactarius akahatsu]
MSAFGSMSTSVQTPPTPFQPVISIQANPRGYFPCICDTIRDPSPTNRPLVETDDCAIPLKPTWSVDDLLSSYPRPTISSPALDRLHVLSALIPPEEGTPEHAKLIRELEDLVKLVKSVRLFNVPTPTHVVADARVWAENTGIDLQDVPSRTHDREALDSAELLSRASRTENGLYVMHSDRVTTKDGSYTVKGVPGLKRVEDDVDANPKFYNKAATSTAGASSC